MNTSHTIFKTLFIVIIIVCMVEGKLVRISNSQPRYDDDGKIVDCHSGMILKYGSRYYMYGERYGNSTGFNTNLWPKLRVYTSIDLVTWTDRGYMLEGDPPGSMFTPWVVYNSQTKLFVAWFNYYQNGCCEGGWGVATSSDGIIFNLIHSNVTGKYPQVDCNGLFVDDDGSAYVIYSSLVKNHMVSIEKLTPDYLNTTGENYGFFPDAYVEGSILFKRNGIYYVAYGSCCCFCRAGSGSVFFMSASLKGPWKRIGDLNCLDNVTVCGSFGERDANHLIIPAQGIGLSIIPTTSGMAYIWQGERWLSAANNNPKCPDECLPPTGDCTEPLSYIKGNGYSYWIPLEFYDDGRIKQFDSFVNEFELDLR